MSKPTQIQIDEQLFKDIAMYLLEENPSSVKKELLLKQIDIKMDSILARKYYTQLKTNSSPEEKLKFKQKYLDLKGVPEEYRY